MKVQQSPNRESLAEHALNDAINHLYKLLQECAASHNQIRCKDILQAIEYAEIAKKYLNGLKLEPD